MHLPRPHQSYGIYVHIPFCAAKCPYCDFASDVVDEVRRKNYLDALLVEILASPRLGSKAETLYLGGGTPSELSIQELEAILEAITSTFVFPEISEWTIECNPNSATGSFLDSARKAGFNRLSLGAQSFQDKHLRTLGRLHTADGVLQAYEAARRCGFEQINLDLIFAIPGLTLVEWKSDLQTAFNLAPEHLSLYRLSIEPKTEFGRLFQSGLLNAVEPDVAADMFELALDLTAIKGYQQYEISNYSRKGCESRHNLRYWRNKGCLGFGLGAASYDRRVRWTNTSDWDSYLQIASGGTVLRAVEEKLTNAHAMAEEVMLRLRTRWGFSPESLGKKFDCDFPALMGELFDSFQREGLVETSRDHICLTRKGLLLADEICARFLQAVASTDSD